MKILFTTHKWTELSCHEQFCLLILYIFSMFVCLLLLSLLLLLLGLSKSCSSQLNPSSSFSCFLIKLCKIQVATIMFLYSLMSQDDICFKIFHLFFHIPKVHSITVLSDEWTMLNFSSRWFPIFKGLTKDAFFFFFYVDPFPNY